MFLGTEFHQECTNLGAGTWAGFQPPRTSSARHPHVPPTQTRHVLCVGPVADQARGRCQKCALQATAIPYGQSETGQAEAAGSQSVVGLNNGAGERVKCGEVASKGGGEALDFTLASKPDPPPSIV